LSRNEGQPRGPWLLRAHVWLVASAIPWMVKVMPLRAMLRLLTPPRTFRPYRAISSDTIVRTVKRRLEKPWHMKHRPCLREGLTLMHFLLLAGAPAEIHFGVFAPNAAGKLKAHCWVTLDGAAVSSPPQSPAAEVLVYRGGDRPLSTM
jgi:hypothetical protein